MLLLGTFLCALLETQMFSTFSIYMTEKLGLTKADVGLLSTCNGAGVLVLQIPALALIQRIGIRVALPWSSMRSAITTRRCGWRSRRSAPAKTACFVAFVRRRTVRPLPQPG